MLISGSIRSICAWWNICQYTHLRLSHMLQYARPDFLLAKSNQPLAYMNAVKHRGIMTSSNYHQVNWSASASMRGRPEQVFIRLRCVFVTRLTENWNTLSLIPRYRWDLSALTPVRPCSKTVEGSFLRMLKVRSLGRSRIRTGKIETQQLCSLADSKSPQL